MLSTTFRTLTRKRLAQIAAAASIVFGAGTAQAQMLNGPGTAMLNSEGTTMLNSNSTVRGPEWAPVIIPQQPQQEPLIREQNFTTQPAKPANPIYDRARYPELWSRGNAPAVEEVRIAGNYAPGSIIIDHARQYLYVTRANGSAMQFPIVVGRSGREISGSNHVVNGMDVDPTWQAPAGDTSPNPFAVPGPRNPLGVRGIYLSTPQGESQGYLIHGTNQPNLFNLADGSRKASNGCIRMLNADVEIVYEMVRVGAPVIIYYNNELVSRITRTATTGPTAQLR